ncbi:MAG: hypothetical protein ACYTG0_20860 [Planctomycetota bacterium]
METPREMLGREALCPVCQAQFRLRLEDSLEYREEKGKERDQRRQAAIRLRLQWTIGAAVGFVIALVVLIVLLASR